MKEAALHQEPGNETEHGAPPPRRKRSHFGGILAKGEGYGRSLSSQRKLITGPTTCALKWQVGCLHSAVSMPGSWWSKKT